MTVLIRMIKRRRKRRKIETGIEMRKEIEVSLGNTRKKIKRKNITEIEATVWKDQEIRKKERGQKIDLLKSQGIETMTNTTEKGKEIGKKSIKTEDPILERKSTFM